MKTIKSSDGTVLAYDVYGRGPALIYITGASCFRNFFPVLQDAKAFAKEFTVYNYDRRGRGDSGNILPWSVEREVEDIEALIGAAGGRANLYGHSSGAVLALEAAMRLGDKIDKVVLYDAAYVHDRAEKMEFGQLGQRVNQLLRDGKNSEALKSFFKGIGMPKAFVFFLPLFPGWKTMVDLAPTLAYDIALTGDVPPIQRAGQVAVPMKIMVGGKSPEGMHHVADQLSKAIPNSKFISMPGQDHMIGAKALLPIFVDFMKASGKKESDFENRK